MEENASSEDMPPYRHVWLPRPGHEATVGTEPWAAVPLPGLDRPVSMRLLRDDAGQVFVSPATGAVVTLNGEQDRPLTPHVWYQLGTGDQIECGEVEIVFGVHQTAADDEPQFVAFYERTHAFYSGPDEFKFLIWPLIVPAERANP